MQVQRLTEDAQRELKELQRQQARKGAATATAVSCRGFALLRRTLPLQPHLATSLQLLLPLPPPGKAPAAAAKPANPNAKPKWQVEREQLHAALRAGREYTRAVEAGLDPPPMPVRVPIRVLRFNLCHAKEASRKFNSLYIFVRTPPRVLLWTGVGAAGRRSRRVPALRAPFCRARRAASHSQVRDAKGASGAAAESPLRPRSRVRASSSSP